MDEKDPRENFGTLSIPKKKFEIGCPVQSVFGNTSGMIFDTLYVEKDKLWWYKVKWDYDDTISPWLLETNLIELTKVSQKKETAKMATDDKKTDGPKDGIENILPFLLGGTDSPLLPLLLMGGSGNESILPFLLMGKGKLDNKLLAALLICGKIDRKTLAMILLMDK